MNEIKSSKKVYLFTVIVVLAVLLLVCGLNGLLTEQKEPKETVKILCDAFFVTGTLVLCIGALTWCSKQGAFDGLGYSISSMINVHKPSKQRLTWSKKETYEEYIERKHANDDGKKFKHLLLVGGILFAVAVILLIVYNEVF